MDFDFATDNGAPCPKCKGTIYTYRTTKNGTATKVSANCIGCHARYPVAFELRADISLTPAVVSAAHRARWA